MTRKIMQSRLIEMTAEFSAKIDAIFEHGGHGRMQINDVLEWLSPDDPLYGEADWLLAQYGDFYIFKEPLP